MVKYTDLNTSFRMSNEDNTILLTDIANIKKSLTRLFNTTKGDVPFNREYGTNLKRLVFDNTLDTSAVAMFLYMDITTFEPRVSLSPNDISIERDGRNSYTINCNFTVPSLNNISGTIHTVIQRE